jgi:hypothetical protein
MSRPATSEEAVPAGAAFSPVDNEAPLRWWRRLRLVPGGDLGTGRRAAILAAIAWLPIALWSLLQGRLLGVDAGEPLLQHYGVHVRCLIAIPLLVLAESALHRKGASLARRFVASGAVDAATRPAFDAVLRDVTRLRDAALPWVLALGAAVAWALADRPDPGDDALSWATDAGGRLGFGGWWFMWVARAIYVALLLGWIWRIGLVTYWMWRVGRLRLALVPTHPDRTGGIAFVETLPNAFTLVTLALAAVLASRWAHEAVHHGATLASFRVPALAFAAGWTLLLLLPLLALAPVLRATRKAALPAYSALAGAQGRAVHRRWIERSDADAEMLEPAGIGPLADAAAAFEASRKLRSVPISRKAVTAILVPMALPFVALAATQVPLKELLIKVLKVLV